MDSCSHNETIRTAHFLGICMFVEKIWLTGVCILLTILIAGCSDPYVVDPLGIDRLDQEGPTALPPVDFSYLSSDIPDVIAAITAYKNGQPDIASSLINRAIQSYPSNADLHYTNGLIYLGWSELGYPQYRELAEIALRVAIQLDPARIESAQILGDVFLARRAYGAALVTLAHAVNQNPENNEAIGSLAAAAYFGERFAVAKWATDILVEAGQDGVELQPLIALANAAVGDVPASERAMSRYALLQTNQASVQRLRRALSEWSSVRSETASIAVDLSESVAARSDIAMKNQADGSADTLSTAVALSERWDTCDESAPSIVTPPAYSSYNSSSTQIPALRATEIKPSEPLTALPSPCADRPLPRMAFVDVVIISADTLTQRKHGENLLDQLEIVASGSISKIRTDGDSSKIITGALALPAAGITYSLNIANARGQRNEIVARPTLVAMDRRLSEFGNGESIFVGVAGNLTGGQLYQIQAGVQLSVIPTFIDDDTVLMAVSASRTLFQDVEESLGEFEEQLLSVRNSVTANVMMDMGQSLILSGLVQRQKQRNSNKIPTEYDVPGLSERTTREFTNSVLFILTPRRAQAQSPGQPSPTIVFSEAETEAYESLLRQRAISAGLNPQADSRLTSTLSTVSRAVVFSPRFLP